MIAYNMILPYSWDVWQKCIHIYFLLSAMNSVLLLCISFWPRTIFNSNRPKFLWSVGFALYLEKKNRPSLWEMFLRYFAGFNLTFSVSQNHSIVSFAVTVNLNQNEVFNIYFGLMHKLIIVLFFFVFFCKYGQNEKCPVKCGLFMKYKQFF